MVRGLPVELEEDPLLRLVSDEMKSYFNLPDDTILLTFENFLHAHGSHSQDFMNNVCTHIVRLDMTYKKLRYYGGECLLWFLVRWIVTVISF